MAKNRVKKGPGVIRFCKDLYYPGHVESGLTFPGFQLAEVPDRPWYIYTLETAPTPDVRLLASRLQNLNPG